MKLLWLFVVFYLCITPSLAEELGNPYKILGVSKKASIQEIRKVYKKLAKEWFVCSKWTLSLLVDDFNCRHPDKSDDPEAQNKFVKIKQAYELLSDSERRLMYDQRGITDDSFRERHDYTKYYNNPLDDLFNHAYSSYQENDISFYQRLIVTLRFAFVIIYSFWKAFFDSRQYDKILVPKSVHTPFIMFLYGDWCFSCMQTVPYFRKLVDHLEPLGVNFAAVHVAHETTLARRLNSNAFTLPSLVMLLDGNVYVYKESISSVQKIIGKCNSIFSNN